MGNSGPDWLKDSGKKDFIEKEIYKLRSKRLNGQLLGVQIEGLACPKALWQNI